jgi:serine protease Do
MQRFMKSKYRWWLAGGALLALAAVATAHPLTRSSDSQQPERTYTTEEAQRAVAEAQGLSLAFRSASEAVLPSVVAIETSSSVAMQAGPRGRVPLQGRNPLEGTPFEDLFRGEDMFRGAPGAPFEMPPMRPRVGIGSGVIIDSDGLILTNTHVVAGGDKVQVRLHDGREYLATEVWTDDKTDIAVVKIEGAEDLQAAKIGDSDALGIGDWVLALGQPFGLESTVTAGIISAKHRGIGIAARENFLQTDAAINPGNSGGPLVNLHGEVVGVNTAISSRSGGNDGIGFAVPISLAQWVAEQLVEHGAVHRAYLGVGIQPVAAPLAKQLNVRPRQGVVVTQVYPDTPAARAGLQPGDVITESNGVAVGSPQQLQLSIERSKLGERHTLKVIRDGKEREVSFVAEAHPEGFDDDSHNGLARPLTSAPLGLEVSELNDDVARQLGMPDVEGVVVTAVGRGSPAERAGLKSGLVVTQVNRRSVTSAEEFKEALNEEGDNLLLVRSAEGSRFVVLSSK